MIKNSTSRSHPTPNQNSEALRTFFVQFWESNSLFWEFTRRRVIGADKIFLTSTAQKSCSRWSFLVVKTFCISDTMKCRTQPHWDNNWAMRTDRTDAHIIVNAKRFHHAHHIYALKTVCREIKNLKWCSLRTFIFCPDLSLPCCYNNCAFVVNKAVCTCISY